MTTTHTPRPEDRQRSGSDPAPWADTLPAFFRSEAFPEDLDGLAEAGQPPHAPVVAAGLSAG